MSDWVLAENDVPDETTFFDQFVLEDAIPKRNINHPETIHSPTQDATVSSRTTSVCSSPLQEQEIDELLWQEDPPSSSSSTAFPVITMAPPTRSYRNVADEECSSSSSSVTFVPRAMTSEEEDSQQHSTMTSTANESILLRRKRNRESMRRTRLREKEALHTLRASLVSLETKYQQLTAVSSSSTEDHHQQLQQHQEIQKLKVKLARVIQVRRYLEAEQQAMQQSMIEKEHVTEQLRQILEDCQLDDRVADKLALLEAQCRQYSSSVDDASESASLSHYEYGFTALSPLQVHHIITQFVQDLHAVKAAHIGGGSASSDPLLEIFGWQTRRHIDNQSSKMHFEFTKQFPQFTAATMMERAWNDGVDLEKYKQTHGRSAHIKRLEFLQQVNANFCVIVREIEHPVEKTIFRTHYVVLGMETQEGFVLGIQSINPPTSELEEENGEEDEDGNPKEKIVWIDAFIAIEFLRRRFSPNMIGAFTTAQPPFNGVDGFFEFPHRGEFCEIRWRGQTDYKTPKHAAESAVGFLMGILRWENVVVGPRFHLTAG